MKDLYFVRLVVGVSRREVINLVKNTKDLDLLWDQWIAQMNNPGQNP